MAKIKILIITIFSFLIVININSVYAEEYSYVHIVNYADPTPLKTIKERYKAFDLTDGDITNNLFFTTNYDENTCTIGSYPLEIKVTNSLGFTIFQTDIILVRDFIPPQIEVVNNEIIMDISKEIDYSIFLQNLLITDNLDLEFNDIIVEGLENINKPGDYVIICYVIDSSTNKSNKVELLVHAFDSVNKIIIIDNLIITENNLTKDEIIERFIEQNHLSDNYTNVTITSDYFNNAHKNGIYTTEIRFDYEDKTATIYNFKIQLEIADNPSNNYIFIYITIGLIVLGIIGIIIYRKRR